MNEGLRRRIVIVTVVCAGIGVALGALNSVDARLVGGLVGALIGASLGFFVSAFPRVFLLVLAASIGPIIVIPVYAGIVSAIGGILEDFGAEPGVATLIAIFAVGSLIAALVVLFVGRRQKSGSAGEVRSNL